MRAPQQLRRTLWLLCGGFLCLQPHSGLSDTSTISLLGESAEHSSESSREQIILEKSGKYEDGIVRTIVQGLRDPSDRVRYAAAWSISVNPALLANSVELILALKQQATSDSDQWVRTEALKSLAALLTIKKESDQPLDKFSLEVFVKSFQENDPYIRRAAVLGLRNFSDMPMVRQMLRNSIHDPDSHVRRIAIAHFDRTGLIISLDDPDPMVRQSALTLLMTSTLKKERNSAAFFVDLVIDRLCDSYEPIAHDAVTWLATLGDMKAIPPLLTLRNTKKGFDAVVQHSIEQITGKPFDEVMTQFDIATLSHMKCGKILRHVDVTRELERAHAREAAVRMMSALNLAWADLPDSTAILILLDDSDARVRYATAEALGEPVHLNLYQSSKNILQALLTAAQLDSNSYVKRRAIASLGSVSWGETRMQFVKQLGTLLVQDRDPFIRLAAAAALSKFRTVESTRTLLQAAHDSFWKIREQVILGADLGNEPQAFSQVRGLSEDPSPNVRQALATVLWQSTDPDALAVLDKLIKDQHEIVRLHAAQSLGNTKQVKASVILEASAKNDPSERVRERARQSLRLLGALY